MTAAAPRICAIIVTHNRLDHLRQTVARVLDEPVDHLIVVDNHSTDGTGEWLRGLNDRRVLHLPMSENRGGAGGFEAGLREARARHAPDWYLVMDDDARPSPGAVTRFRDTIRFYPQDQPVGVVLAAVRFPAGPICEMNRPWRNPFWHKGIFLRTLLGGGRKGFHIQDGDYAGAEPLPVDGGSFVGQFISAAAVDRCGYPDGRLFIYGDDVLYTLRLARAGFRNWFDPRVHWEHDFGTFDRAHQRAYYPLWKVYYNFRNGLMLYREAAGPLLFWGVLLLVVPKWRRSARHYGADSRTFLRLLHRAIWDALHRRLDISHPEVLAMAERAARD